MTLLAALCSLRCLDVRGTAFSEAGLQGLLSGLQLVACRDTLQVRGHMGGTG